MAASRWRFAAAASGIVCSGALSLGLLYALDFAIGLPLSIRRLLLAAWAFCVFLAMMWALRRFLKPIDAATIARAAAGRLPPPHRADFIAAAMLIDDAERSEWPAISPAQRTAALQHAAARIGDLPWHRGLSVGRATALLALTWLAVAFAFAFAGNGVFVQRWFAEPLAIATSQDKLEFVDLPSRAVEFQNVLIRVRVPKGLPIDLVELSAVGEHGGVEAGPIEPPVGSWGQTRRFIIKDVRSALILRARCGSFADTPGVALRLLRAAQVLSHEFEVTPPDYTGMPRYRSRESAITAVEGTDVDVIVEADRRLHGAGAGFDRLQLRFFKSVTLDSTATAWLRTLAIDDPASDSQTRDVYLAVLDEYEAVHYPEYPLQVRVVRDAPPSIELQPPTTGTGTTAFDIRGRATDEFGLRAVSLHLEAVDGEATVEPLFQASVGVAVKTQAVVYAVSYEQLAAAGATVGAVSVWLSAEDTLGQVTRSVPFRIEIDRGGGVGTSPAEELASIIRRQRLLAADLDRLAAQPVLRRDDADRAAEDQEKLADDWADSAGRVQSRDESKTKAVRQAEASMRAAALSVEARQLQAAQAAQRAALAALSSLHNQSTAQEPVGNAGDPQDAAAAQQREGGIDAERWRQWADAQTTINSRIDASRDADVGEVAADQARLQAEVRVAAAALPAGDRRRWAADSAVRLQSQVAAALQRGRLEAPLPQRAALAATYLESIAAATEDEAIAAVSGGASEGDSPSAQPRISPEVLGELRVIERVQSQLRSQLSVTRGDGTGSAAGMQGYRDAQSALAERLREIASAAGGELDPQSSAAEAE